ncbi:Uncharacterised protein [Mycobacterium tuberculosis]|uniref:Uncharacterized protein n=1 Tax=Mycobacterium tuberculosis TaxID=1773 RepID=A0A916LCN9_MYCTX|nr:hypothetical protein IQ38_14965 [Mycobacterium tuberculosis]AIH56132.1 hypothetical protein IQ41_14060 [Mycobacterium tuberculosis]AIH68225.1 hypothetical protein IU17_14445 [Mycobacterium tuberculosis]CKT22454.1 Uncharacterised protein [Mycobacterium tuberculosis]CNL89535.1 Uncharacterised protein [Mycobacterium tuberculosis]
MRRIPPVIFRTTPTPRTPAECGARAGTNSAGTCCALVIADSTAAVSPSSGEYQITTDAVRG